MTSKYASNTDHLFLQLPERTLGVYNAWDTYWTAKLVGPLLRQVERVGNLGYYTDIMEPLQYAVIDMQKRGMLLDATALARYRKKVKDEINECARTILAADPTGKLAAPTGKSPNGIGSSRRLAHFLFTVLDLKATKRTETGMDSTDQESLYRLLRNLRKKDRHARPVLLALFHRSRLRTISQRYLNLEADPDGRVRAKVKMYGTKTLRFSYSEPALQQFPPEARHIFRASPGFVFLSVDYSQLEARILAHLSNDVLSIQPFQEGGDVHAANARDLFGWTVSHWEGLLDEVRKSSRGFSKSFLFGISYGGEAETIKTKLYCPCPKCIKLMPDTLNLTRDQIAEAAARWFHRHPEVKRWHKELLAEVQRTCRYTSPLGIVRHFSQPYGSELEREVKNAPMQTGAAILMNRAQIQLHKIHAPVVLQMHDEFILEVPVNEVDEWAKVTQDIMETPVPELNGVSFPTTVEVGETWGKMKSYTYPRTTSLSSPKRSTTSKPL